MPLVIAEAFRRLPVGEFRIQVNNRKIPEGFYLGIGLDRRRRRRCASSTSSTRSGPGPVAEMLVESGATEDQARQVLALASISSSRPVVRGAVRALGVQHPTLDEGLDALAAVIAVGDGAGARACSSPTCSIARGLDYYTGTVYETQLVGSRVVGLGVLRRSLRLAGHRRPHHLPGGRHLDRAVPARAPARQPSAGSRPAARPRPPCSSPSSTRRAARPPAGWPRRCGRAASRARWRPARRSSASRSATPTGAASRSSGSPVPGRAATRSRTSARASRSTPTRRRGSARADLKPDRRHAVASIAQRADRQWGSWRSLLVLGTVRRRVDCMSSRVASGRAGGGGAARMSAQLEQRPGRG